MFLDWKFQVDFLGIVIEIGLGDGSLFKIELKFEFEVLFCFK
jgi:hypothetical protein